MSAADRRLLGEAKTGNVGAVDELLRGGQARIDGSDQGRPIVVAASHDRIDVINLLARRGADLNAAVHGRPSDIIVHAPPGVHNPPGPQTSAHGWRALHAAVGAGRCNAIGALLELGADPNCADDFGITPLMLACRMPVAGYRLRVAKQLLQGGSNPALRCKHGAIALTYAAALGDVELINFLVASAPATINHSQFVLGNCFTPLASATTNNREDAVRALLSLGANDSEIFRAHETSSLLYAAEGRLESMVKLFLQEGLEAVGGFPAVARVLCEAAVEPRNARILQMLISVEGEEKQQRWARQDMGGIPLLHAAAAFDSLNAVSVLLAAGADESLVSFIDAQRLRPRDVIGARVPDEKKDEVTEAAIGRVLQRGPAFRARSWAWPAPPAAGGGAGVGRGGSAGTAAIPGGLRIYRPTARLFISRVTRYANH